MTGEADLRTITAIAPLVRSGTLSPVTLVRSCLAQLDAHADLNAFITRLDASALKEAAEREADIRAGNWRGPLDGIPIAVKDLVDVAGTRTTSGSALPANVIERDAPSVVRLRAAGAILIGKTNLHEFAFGTTSDETAFGPVRNPFDRSRSAGGSSGGSAAALATGMCFGALGTDTGGSIRIPSAACGTVGLKPTLNEISCDGVVPLSATLDHLGPMTRSVADAALIFDVLKGRDPHVRQATKSGTLTFGIPQGFFRGRVEPGVERVFDRARDAIAKAGHTTRDVEIEHAAWTPDAYLHIVLPEASRYHAPWLEQFADRYSPGVRLRLEMGRYILAEDYVRAMRLREALTKSVERALEGCDALLLPAMAIPAPPVGATTVDVNGTMEPVRAAMLRLTQLFNVTGHPAVALPVAHDIDPLPRGIQIVGRRNETDALLGVAIEVERIVAV